MTPDQIPKKFVEKDQKKKYTRWLGMVRKVYDNKKLDLEQLEQEAIHVQDFSGQESGEEKDEDISSVPSEIEDTDEERDCEREGDVNQDSNHEYEEREEHEEHEEEQ
jgi:hypothetical protein